MKIYALVKNKTMDKKYWKEIATKYPETEKMFRGWLVQYQIGIHWHFLFNATATKPSPKIHNLPVAMQIGIITQFVFDFAIDKLEFTAPFQPKQIVECVFDAIEQSMNQ